MFGVFGLPVMGTVVLCIFVVLLGICLAGLGAAMLDGDDPFSTTLVILIGLVIGAIACAYIINEPDGYIGEAKYVENVMNYDKGSGSAMPIVEVEGKGRFPVDGSGIVSYEIGDMIPVECYDNSCNVR